MNNLHVDVMQQILNLGNDISSSYTNGTTFENLR